MKTSTYIVGWILALLSIVVYLLTLAPTVSFWDCGEFIATSYGLHIGHPPGAPFYQLVAHLFTLLAPSPERVAWWSNALSALAGGLTVMLLYWIIRLLTDEKPSLANHIAAVVGAMCYLFCDTAWFSAVESEVYSMAMFMAALLLWLMLRWYRCKSPTASFRWLALVALCLGLAVCVHLMCLLTIPALLLLGASKGHPSFWHWWHSLPTALRPSRRKACQVALLIFLFAIGLTPYLIIPIRSAANPPINYCKSDDFLSYVRRDQYAHAPLYPRMWRHQGNDDAYAKAWSGGNDGFLGNACYFLSYQLGYMYLRYLMWNFSGRYDSSQGFGSLQHGQFITGIPPIDRFLVGIGRRPPDAMRSRGRQTYFLLPFFLGMIGLLRPELRSRIMRWIVWLLFLFGGILLSLYLNHPAYEPRERDYAYILSFFAFCIWIALGVERVSLWGAQFSKRLSLLVAILCLSVPVLMACQNWRGHDRSECRMARQVAENLLASCQPGSILFTYGDNDTFPLWYLQHVEGRHTDVQVYNVNLIGGSRFAQMLLHDRVADSTPVYFSHYAYDAYRVFFPGRLRLAGYVYRFAGTSMQSSESETVDIEASLHAMRRQIAWHIPQHRDMEEVAKAFISQYLSDVLRVADCLYEQDRLSDAALLLKKTHAEIPMFSIRTFPDLAWNYLQHLSQSGLQPLVAGDMAALSAYVDECLDYYHSLSPNHQALLHHTIEPYELLSQNLSTLLVSRSL